MHSNYPSWTIDLYNHSWVIIYNISFIVLGLDARVFDEGAVVGLYSTLNDFLCGVKHHCIQIWSFFEVSHSSLRTSEATMFFISVSYAVNDVNAIAIDEIIFSRRTFINDSFFSPTLNSSFIKSAENHGASKITKDSSCLFINLFFLSVNVNKVATGEPTIAPISPQSKSYLLSMRVLIPICLGACFFAECCLRFYQQDASSCNSTYTKESISCIE